MKTIQGILMGLALLALPFAASAGRPRAKAADRPVNLMTMQQVRQQFGVPRKKDPAVGDPPITRWVYPHYIVYFENDLVLHTVAKKKPFHDAPPAPVVKHLVTGN